MAGAGSERAAWDLGGGPAAGVRARGEAIEGVGKVTGHGVSGGQVCPELF